MLGADFAYAGFQSWHDDAFRDGRGSAGFAIKLWMRTNSTGYILGEVDEWGDELHLYLDDSGQLIWRMFTPEIYVYHGIYSDTTFSDRIDVSTNLVLNDGL